MFHVGGTALPSEFRTPFAKQLGLAEGSPVDLGGEHGSLIVKPAAPALEDLLDKITPENVHGEVRTGSPLGRERW